MTTGKATLGDFADAYQRLVELSPCWCAEENLRVIRESPDPFVLPEWCDCSEHFTIRRCLLMLKDMALGYYDAAGYHDLESTVRVRLDELIAKARTAKTRRERAIAEASRRFTIDEKVVARVPRQHRDQLRRYLRALDAEELMSEGAVEVYLFGSMTTGRHLSTSDIDVAVVTGQFAPVPEWKRREQLLRVGGNSFSLIDPVGLTFHELEVSRELSIVETVHSQGIRVAWK